MSANNGGKPASYGNIDITGSVNEVIIIVTLIITTLPYPLLTLYYYSLRTGSTLSNVTCPPCRSAFIRPPWGPEHPVRWEAVRAASPPRSSSPWASSKWASSSATFCTSRARKIKPRNSIKPRLFLISY